MYKTQSEAKELISSLLSSLKKNDNVEIAVMPPFTSLQAVKKQIEGSSIKLGAQNMHWEKQGAYTGEVSSDMLIESGCDFVIIGHSERRQYFTETDETVNKKILSALEAGIDPIFCVGELLEHREQNQHEDIVGTQIEIGLKNISDQQINKITIAYEPVWAIGTGKTATPEIANNMHKFIRNKIKDLYNDESAENIKILYGGSVKPENISSLIVQEDIDGALVGGASLKPELFIGIINGCC